MMTEPLPGLYFPVAFDGDFRCPVFVCLPLHNQPDHQPPPPHTPTAHQRRLNVGCSSSDGFRIQSFGAGRSGRLPKAPPARHGRHRHPSSWYRRHRLRYCSPRPRCSQAARARSAGSRQARPRWRWRPRRLAVVCNQRPNSLHGAAPNGLHPPRRYRQLPVAANGGIRHAGGQFFAEHTASA